MRAHFLTIGTLLLAVCLLPARVTARPSDEPQPVDRPAGVSTTTYPVDSAGDGSDYHDASPGNGTCADSLARCGLRTALEEANAHPGPDTITFASAMNITLDSSLGGLPSLVDPVSIDASNVWDGIHDVPGVTLSCGGLDVYGIDISTDHCAVYGLTITACQYGAIRADSAYNNIGGTATGQRNVLSGNGGSGSGVGIYLVGSGAQYNVVQNNIIGLDAAGNAKVPNSMGVRLVNQASHNLIGGTMAGSGNIISGNTSNGVDIGGPDTDGNQLSDNLIGLGADGVTPMGNGNRGIAVNDSTDTQIGGAGLLGNTVGYNGSVGIDLRQVSNTTVQNTTIHNNDGEGIYLVGADSMLAFNTIAYNAGDGVRVSGASSLRNQMSINSIYANDGRGIQLENGANAMLPAPTILTATVSGVSGTAGSGARVVWVYSDAADEGYYYHDSCIVNTTTGEWSYTGPVNGPNATALATDLDGNTSRFSAPLPVSASVEGTCASPLPIDCGQQLSGDTTGRPNNHPLYGCGWDASGPELIYGFTLPAGGNRTVKATISNLTVDLDVYLLDAGGCDAGSCLLATAYGNTQAVAANVPPGSYFIAVDGFQGAAGSFDLALDCGSHVRYLPLMVKNR